MTRTPKCTANFTATEEEVQAIDAAAEKAGLSRAQFMKRVVMEAVRKENDDG